MDDAIRVLCVDDDAAVLDTTAAFIEREGLTAMAETSVRAAIERLEAEHVDCIVSDYRMPRLNGLDFLDTVRDIRPNIPFILFTGEGSEEIASEAISAGVTDYLQKGRTTDQYEVLTNRIENAVAKRRTERDLRHAEARYRRLAEQNLVGIYIVQNGRIEYANPKLADILGYDRDELRGMSPLALVADDHDPDRAAESLAGHEQGELGEAHYTLTGRRKDGTTVAVEVHGGRIEYEGESAVIGVCKDVDDRRRREYTLRALHDATGDLMRAHSDEAVAERAVEAAADVLGFSIAAIRLYDPETDRLQPIAVTDATTELLGERPAYGCGEALPWRAFSSGEPIIADGSIGSDSANDLPFRHTLYVPIESHGTLSIGSAETEFTDADIRLAQVLVASAAAALDRVAHESALERYETIVETVNDAVYTVDSRGRFDFVNEAFATLSGYSREELLGSNVALLKNDATVERFEDAVHRLLRGELDQITVELPLQTTDGEVIPCEDHLTLLPCEEEYQGCAGVIRDLTERKRRERMVETLHDTTRRMMRATTQTEVAEIAVETIESVFGMAVNGVWLTDESEGVLRPAAISERGRELFGTPPTYTEGNSLSWAAFEHSETRTYDRIDTKKSVHNPDTQVKSEIIAPLGDYGVLNIGSTEPGAFDDGDVSLANLLAANTEAALDRAERERLLREREHELERQNEQLEEFASVVSHDLRTPLGVARGRLELAHEEHSTEHHEDVRWALSRMDSLTEDLLTLARQGKVVSETAVVSLESVARAAWTGIESESADLAFEDDLGDIEADADRLQRLLENLFRNAVEHSSHGVSVRVGRSPEGFWVADDGPGIAKSDRERVFESGHSTGEGTGLGLAIVKTIAEAHGWTVSVFRSDAGGTRFDIRT